MASPHNLQNRTRSPLVITFAACGCLIAALATGIMVAVAAVIINMPKAANPPSPTSSASTSSFSPSASADETSLPPASPTPGVPQPTPGRPSTNTGDKTDDTINARLPDTVGEWDLAHIGTRPIYARGENTISILITDIADGKATAENPSWGLEGETVFRPWCVRAASRWPRRLHVLGMAQGPPRHRVFSAVSRCVNGGND